MSEPHSKLWAAVSPYLDEALERDPAEREKWLVALGVTHPAVAAELRELLALHDANHASGFMERSPLRNEEPLTGEQIGPYTLERLLGRGGMGSVWLARRSDGKFEGTVAIKLLDRRGLGRDAAEQIRHEASLLARLSHPHIARLFDAGVRENGQPYLILEYVEGERIDRYCEMRKLTLSERLRLFLGVLDAIAHAHAHLVVHRDLKPSNVLVTAEGSVKLLDFGVASLQQDQATGTAANESASQGLTPGYAAPEQLRGEVVSTAADVYALGVLLHVLVTGEHPLAASAATPAALVSSVLKDEIAPASERIPSGAERRHVRGDLDAVIARAMSREPASRYAGAGELAADIRRFLENFPVHARSASRLHAARKFTQRHWGSILTAVTTLLLLLGATVVVTLQMLEARQQRDLTSAALARAEALNDLDDYVLLDAAPAGKPFTVKELLDRAARMVERAHISNPARAALLASLGRKYLTQDDQHSAVKLVSEAYRLSLHAPDPSVRATAACVLASALVGAGGETRSEELIAEGLRQLPDRAEFAMERASCLQRGAEVAREAGRTVLAIERATAARQAMQEVPFEHEIEALRVEEDVAESLRQAGQFRDAVAVFEQIWPRLAALGRDDTTTAAVWLNNWGVTLYQLGRPLEAEQLLRRSIDLSRADSSTERVSPMTLTNYAQQLLEIGRVSEAQRYAEQAYADALTAEDEVVLHQSMLRLARIYRAQHEYDRSNAMLSAAEPIMRNSLPPDHYGFGSLASERSLNAEAEGATGRALELADQAVAIVENSLKHGKSGAQLLPILLARRASIEVDGRQLPAAERDAREALRMLRSAIRPGDSSAFIGRASLCLARALSAEGKDSEARAAAREAAEHLGKTVGLDNPETHAALELSREPQPGTGQGPVVRAWPNPLEPRLDG